MPLSRVKTWVAGEVLAAADLNNEFNNILNNGQLLVQPWVGSFDLDGNTLILDQDADTTIDAATDDTIDIMIAGSDDVRLTSNTVTLLSGTNLDVANGTIDISTGNLILGEGEIILSNFTLPNNSTSYLMTIDGRPTGTPANGLGVGIKFVSESLGSSPADLGNAEFVFSDVGSSSEDSYFQILTRVAGAALAATYRWVATAANKAIFTHANSADRTYTLPNASGTIIVGGAGSGLIGTTDLKTATGSATVADSQVGGASGSTASNQALNAYSFFPSLTYDAVQSFATYSGYGDWLAHGDTVDPADQIGRVRLVATSVGDAAASSGTTTVTLRWRYITASDNPDIWVAYDITGKIKGVWTSDDAIAGIPITVEGCTSLQVKAADLEAFSLLSTKASDAQAYIQDRKLNMKHHAYRALQLLTEDEAPSRWILEHCTVEQNKLKLL